ncbi:MAG: methyltransferase [Roseburia sp.]|nr:methyltransferase [Anaeroplasma bactoclasticum]MCM1196676.1 methyltransferase [Roseburia sp.]
MANNYHYYQENQEGLHSNPSTFTFNFKNEHFKFHTDDGVFSKNYIDYGSFVLLKNYVQNDINGPILDMGAGYGAIGIVLARLYSKEVHMCEINERAYNLLNQNLKENQIKNAFLYHSNLFDALDGNLKFSSVVTNPPIRAGKQVVYAIYDGAYERLLENGELWVVIQKKQGAPSSKDYLTNKFGNCEIIARDKGYYILKSIRK